jgi:hypothetical protein
VHHSKFRWLMSALGHKRTFRKILPMSALPPKADIVQQGGNVRFVPETLLARGGGDFWLSDQVCDFFFSSPTHHDGLMMLSQIVSSMGIAFNATCAHINEARPIAVKFEQWCAIGAFSLRRSAGERGKPSRRIPCVWPRCDRHSPR